MNVDGLKVPNEVKSFLENVPYALFTDGIRTRVFCNGKEKGGICRVTFEHDAGSVAKLRTDTVCLFSDERKS